MDEVRLAYYQRQVEMETDRLEQDVPSDIHSDDEFVAEEPIQHFMQTILWSLDKLEDKVQRLSEDELLLDKHRVQDVKNDLTAMKERISEVLPELIKSSREMHNKSPTADDSNDPMPEKNENKGVKKIDVTDINFTWPIDERKTFKALTKKVKESPIYADLLTAYFQRPKVSRKLSSFFTWNILHSHSPRNRIGKVLFKDSPVMNLIACAWSAVDRMSTNEIYEDWGMQLLRMGNAEHSRRYRERKMLKVTQPDIDQASGV